jgi:hypothetical protein
MTNMKAQMKALLITAAIKDWTKERNKIVSDLSKPDGDTAAELLADKINALLMPTRKACPGPPRRA